MHIGLIATGHNRHPAYGTRSLKTATTRDEPWFSLWSAHKHSACDGRYLTWSRNVDLTENSGEHVGPRSLRSEGKNFGVWKLRATSRNTVRRQPSIFHRRCRYPGSRVEVTNQLPGPWTDLANPRRVVPLNRSLASVSDSFTAGPLLRGMQRRADQRRRGLNASSSDEPRPIERRTRHRNWSLRIAHRLSDTREIVLREAVRVDHIESIWR